MKKPDAFPMHGSQPLQTRRVSPAPGQARKFIPLKETDPRGSGTLRRPLIWSLPLPEAVGSVSLKLAFKGFTAD